MIIEYKCYSLKSPPLLILWYNNFYLAIPAPKWHPFTMTLLNLLYMDLRYTYTCIYKCVCNDNDRPQLWNMSIYLCFYETWVSLGHLGGPIPPPEPHGAVFQLGPSFADFLRSPNKTSARDMDRGGFCSLQLLAFSTKPNNLRFHVLGHTHINQALKFYILPID